MALMADQFSTTTSKGFGPFFLPKGCLGDHVSVAQLIPTQIVDFQAIVDKLGLVDPFLESTKNFGRVVWPHSLVVRHRMIKSKRAIVGVDKGMAKTWAALSVFEDPLVNKGIPGFTVLILCPEKGMGSYIRDIKMFPNWEGKIQLVYGSKASRERQWKNSTARYFICTYASFLSDSGQRTNSKVTKEVSELIVPDWVLRNQIDGVVCDEYHRYFRRKESKTFQVLERLFRHTEYFFPMSGSVLSKGPQDAWAALHMCDRNLWSSYWKYVYTWCEVDDGMFGKVVGGPRRDRVDKWQTAVSDNLIYITADMVADMPPKTRDFLDCEMTPQQRRLHDDLTQRLFYMPDDESGDIVFAENALVKIHKLRMALICPEAVSPGLGVGQGIEDIWDDAQDSGVNQYAIFTPFKAPLPILAGWLRNKGARVWVLQGGIGLDEQTRRLDDWRGSLSTADPDHPSIILSTTKYAESWEVPEARYGYMLGYEWDPEDNKQAEDRLRRLISIGMTYIRYVRHKNAYDSDMMELIIDKMIDVRHMFANWIQFRNYVSANQKSH